VRGKVSDECESVKRWEKCECECESEGGCLFLSGLTFVRCNSRNQERILTLRRPGLRPPTQGQDF